MEQPDFLKKENKKVSLEGALYYVESSAHKKPEEFEPDFVDKIENYLVDVIGPELEGDNNFFTVLRCINYFIKYQQDAVAYIGIRVLDDHFEAIEKKYKEYEKNPEHPDVVKMECVFAASNLMMAGSEYKEKGVNFLKNNTDFIFSGFYNPLFKREILQIINRLSTNLSLMGNISFNEIVRLKIEEFLSKYPDDYFFLAHCLQENLCKLEETAILSKIASFGLPPQKTFEVWSESKEKIGGFGEVLSDNFQALKSIERQRPGIAHLLNKQFNIFHFDRYTRSMLIRQYDEYENLEKPYGVVLYPFFDHNGSFYRDKEVLLNLFQQIKGKFAIRICEGEDKIDIARLLNKLNKKYGKERKISFAIIGGHGTKDSIRFGEGEFERNKLHTTDLQDWRADKKDYFEERPTIILISCSTGFEGGIGQEMSHVLNAEVIAPREDTNIKKIDVEIGENDPLKFDVQYTDDNVETKYSGGEKK